MASDSLKQVGNFIKDTNKKANQGLKRYSKNLPVVENTRDIFDPTISFEMFFRTEENQKEVILDMKLSKPPPMKGCRSACHMAACEQFNLPAGEQVVTLQEPPIAGTVDVFVNGEILSNLQSYIIPSNQVFLQSGSNPTNIVVVCYIWSSC